MQVQTRVMLIGALLSLPACGSAERGNGIPVKQARLDGLLLAGTAADAKAMGFTECKVDYYAATCRNPQASLFGMKGPAAIRMDLENGHMPSDLTKLSYKSIEFEVPKLDISYPCEKDEELDPLECVEDGKAAELQRALVSRGWKMREWRGHRGFYKRQYEAEIDIVESSVSLSANGVAVRFADQDEVESTLRGIEARQVERKASDTRASDLQNAMASGNNGK